MFKRKILIPVLLVAALSLAACSLMPASLTAILNRDNGQTEPVQQEPMAQTEKAPQATQEETETASQSVAEESEELAALQGTLEEIYQRVNPSVVNIQVTINGDSQIRSEFTFPFDQYQGEMPSQHALGSGFVWNKDGYIVTNNHVVENADKILVTFEDGRILDAEVVGTDPDADLAVIHVEADADSLKPVKVADSSKVKVGQLAIAIGNPFALQGTMTVGIVSALDRSLPVNSNSWNGASYTIPEIIQTDAPINPGNSGGVLLNADGEVIGVPTAIESTTEASAGIGFVIPSEIVLRVVPQLIENGEFLHPWLGISGSTLTSPVASEMGLDEGQRGVLIAEVISGSPADKAGLRGSDRQVTINDNDTVIGGDVIIQIGDEKVNMFDDVASYLVRKGEIGKPLDLVILRDGKEKTVEVTLEERPNGDSTVAEVERNGIGSRKGSAWLGISGMTMNSEVAAAMNLDEDQQGVLVAQIIDNGPADEAGLQGSFESIDIDGQQLDVGGDVIVSVDKESVTGMPELLVKISQKDPGDEVTLGVVRDGKEMSIDVTLGEKPSDN